MRDVAVEARAAEAPAIVERVDGDRLRAPRASERRGRADEDQEHAHAC